LQARLRYPNRLQAGSYRIATVTPLRRLSNGSTFYRKKSRARGKYSVCGQSDLSELSAAASRASSEALAQLLRTNPDVLPHEPLVFL
jgi:hypothetical protein